MPSFSPSPLRPCAVLTLWAALAPGARAEGSARIGAWVTYWDFDRGQQRLASAPGLLDDVFFFAFELGADGMPAEARPGLPMAPALAALRQRGAHAWMTVVNDTRDAAGKVTLKDAAAVHRVLVDERVRAAHRGAIADLATLHGFSGVDIDYEDLHVEDRDAFTLFVRELREELRARGLRLSVTVQPKRQESRSKGPGAADWAALCRASDRLQVMLYNLHNARTPPGPVTAPAWFAEVLGFARAQCGEASVVPVLKLGAMDWGPKGMKELQHAEVVPLLEQYQPSLARETEGGTPFFRYSGPDGAHTVYFEDATSIETKLAALERLGYRDVVLWSLGREDPELLRRLQARKAATSLVPQSIPSAVLSEQEALQRFTSLRNRRCTCPAPPPSHSHSPRSWSACPP